jgi:hypothetical protein
VNAVGDLLELVEDIGVDRLRGENEDDSVARIAEPLQEPIDAQLDATCGRKWHERANENHVLFMHTRYVVQPIRKVCPKRVLTLNRNRILFVHIHIGCSLPRNGPFKIRTTRHADETRASRRSFANFGVSSWLRGSSVLFMGVAAADGTPSLSRHKYRALLETQTSIVVDWGRDCRSIGAHEGLMIAIPRES